ncbi:hypothetical protein NV379_10890 [Paenibacillus sp. N1-5-1-14]|uniref:hypothetical protein n=1 Tax=Paenibacillus radicibacter TaxID=2972488 RepID=UPI002158F90A|nr:hypothetical protein [Paenibacillus radicibacter]MCR8643166.1 hypothetical protein [Paenibacillus radicibacter]
MNKRFGLKVTHLALTTTLIFSLAVPSAWAASEGASNQVTEIASIVGQNSVSFSLKNIRLLPQKESSTVTFTITVKNDGSQPIALTDYMARLKDASGETYLTRLAPQDKSKRKLAAGSTQDLIYYAQVGDMVDLSGLSVDVIKWDFSKPKYEANQGNLAVPDTFTGAVTDGLTESILIGDTPIEMSVSQFHQMKSGDNYIPTLYIDLKHNGRTAVTPPDYQFFIRTKDGSTYPIIRRDELKSLNPNITTPWRLTGTIPTSVDPEGWQLVVAEHSEAAKLDVPVAVFELAESESAAPGSGEHLKFSTNAGMYTGELGSMYRVPWEDEDMITANVTISNTDQDHSLTVPKLSAYYLLDGKVKVPANVVQTSRALSIGTGSSEVLQVVGKLPIDQAFKSIKLVLQEKESESEDAKLYDIAEFTERTVLPRIPFYRAGDGYKTAQAGRKAYYAVHGVNRYKGGNSELFAVQVEVDNLERRSSDLSRIVAYLQTEDGDIFPTQISAVKGKVGPRGTALLEIWSEIPQDYATSSLHLVMGDAVTGNKLTEGEAVPDSYINPVGMWLPSEKYNVASEIKQLDLYPYTIKFSNMNTSSNVRDFAFKLDYEILKSKLVQANNEKRNLVIAIEDASGYNFFEKSFNVNEFESATTSGKEAGGVMKIGKGQLSFTIPNTDPVADDHTYKPGTIKIYDEFQGKRKLIATQKITLISIIEKKGKGE